MNWFGPDGDCGCCDTYVCDDHTCTTRVESAKTIRTLDGVDLLECECAEWDSGAVITRSTYEMTVNLTGTAGSQTWTDTTLGTLTTTAVDLSGTYTYSRSVSSDPDGGCTVDAGGPYYSYVRIHSELMGTSGGFDVYASIFIEMVGLVVYTMLEFVTSGNPLGSTPNLWDEGKSYTSNPFTVRKCGTTCYCGYVVTNPQSLSTVASSHPSMFSMTGITFHAGQEGVLL